MISRRDVIVESTSCSGKHNCVGIYVDSSRGNAVQQKLFFENILSIFNQKAFDCNAKTFNRLKLPVIKLGQLLNEKNKTCFRRQLSLKSQFGVDFSQGISLAQTNSSLSTFGRLPQNDAYVPALHSLL